MTPRWTVREYRPGDEAGINDLFLRVFGIRRSLAEWRWKFMEGPGKERSLIFLAHDGARIVGQYTVLFRRFLFGGREVLAAQPVDNMIDPAFRQGLGRARMQRALYRAIQNHPLQAVTAMGYGFPNHEAYRVGRKLLGYRDVGPVHVRLRSLTWARHIRRLAGGGWASRMGGRAHAWAHRHRLRLAFPAPPPPPGTAVRRLPSFDERFDRLWEAAAPSFGVLAVRDRRHLEWRYGSRPSGGCTILGLEKGRALLGYAVLANREGPDRFGLLADILCLPGQGLAESLILRALDQFLETGCDMAECWSPAGGRHEVLLQKYFPRSLPDPIPAVTRIYDDTLDLSLVSDLSRWHITMGDADGV
jgi:predicted N-acetyltransferase YhbS